MGHSTWLEDRFSDTTYHDEITITKVIPGDDGGTSLEARFTERGWDSLLQEVFSTDLCRYGFFVFNANAKGEPISHSVKIFFNFQEAKQYVETYKEEEKFQQKLDDEGF
jgi:hypothetical protein